MQIIVLADDLQKKEFLSKKIPAEIKIKFIGNYTELSDYTTADAFFILQEDYEIDFIKQFNKQPVFINSVASTLKELRLPENFIRINGWNTFAGREVWEIATNNEKAGKDNLEKLGWKYLKVADEPGLVAARVICMIINEAYFALGEDVSTKDEIDLAMKLGTNYPFGPFEWSEKIGLKKIYDLLKRLAKKDIRYTIAPEMEKEVMLLNKSCL